MSKLIQAYKLMEIKINDRNNLALITSYCLIFAVLRFLCSLESFTIDEAKQFFDSEHYQLGYPDQPPLFSWILKTSSLIFGLNIPLMIVVTHILIWAIFILVYRICRKQWDEKQSLIIVSSLVFFILYSYDFYRYMIHSILITAIAALSLLIYLNLLKQPNLINYLLLGASFGLGILAKYNFVFFILTLVLASLIFQDGRKTLLSLKSILSLLMMLLIISPHLIWLYENDFITIHYAMNRSESGSQATNFLVVLIETYWNYVLYLSVFLLFFNKSLISKDQLLTQNQLLTALRSLAIASFVVPLLIIIILKTGNFTNRWLSPLYITFALGLFSLVDFKKFKFSKHYFSLVIIVVISIYGIKIANYFFTDLSNPSFIHKPFRGIYSQLEPKLIKNKFIYQSIEELPIYSYKEQNIIAGVKLFNPRARLAVVSNTRDIKPPAILIWDPDKSNRKSIENKLKQNGYHIEKSFNIKSNYLYSHKYVYKIAIALISD